MRCVIVLLSVAFVFLSCQEKEKETPPKSEVSSASGSNEVERYPVELQKVFKAHGGLEHWKRQRTLSFVIAKPENAETHIIDLNSRKDKIETEQYDMGFDGENPWLLNKEGAYGGNVEFYHNLMFYFYAMPFVLADDGIQYEKAKDLEFEGKNYPGFKISYHSGVGTSPKDEYYIHYDPSSYTMQWLGYTVTYSTQEKSDKVRWIRYNDWDTYNGLILPKSISWYNYEGMNIKDLRNTVSFKDISVSVEAKPNGFYDKPVKGHYFVKAQE